jgi:hypothetical protein
MRTILFICLFLGLTSIQDVQANNSTLPTFVIESCNLPAANNLHVTATTTSSISFAWDAVPGAAAYFVEVGEVAISTSPVYSNIVTGTSLTVTGLNSGTLHGIRVHAVDPTGCISPNFAYKTESTQFVIIDDLVFERKTYPNTVTCTTLLTLPVQLALMNQNSVGIFTFFEIQLIDGKISVLHVNPDIINGPYKVGVHFGNLTDLPLIEQGPLPQPASNVYVYNLTSNASKSSFPISNFMQTLEITRQSGGQINICSHNVGLPGGLPIVRAEGYIPPFSGSGSADRDAENTPLTPIISPNPFADDISIDLGGLAGKNAELRLFDANGRQVRTHQMGEEDQTATIQTEDLSPGMYVLRFQNDSTSKTYKLVKMGW